MFVMKANIFFEEASLLDQAIERLSVEWVLAPACQTSRPSSSTSGRDPGLTDVAQRLGVSYHAA